MKKTKLTSILPLEQNSNIRAELFASIKQPKNPFKFSCLISRILFIFLILKLLFYK